MLRSPRRPDLPPLTGGFVGFVAYDAVRRLERLPDLNPDDLGVPELAMMLATDLAVLDHLDGSVLLVANVIADPDVSPDDAYADAQARLDAMTADLAGPAPASAASLDLDAEPPISTLAPDGLVVPAGGRARRRRRSGPARCSRSCSRSGSRIPVTTQLARRLPRAAHDEPEPVHVPAAVRRVRRRRVQPGAAGPGRGRSRAGPADRRQPTARRDARPRTPHSAPSCWPTRRSAPSTSCWSTSAATTSGGSARRAASRSPTFMAVERFSHVMHLVSTVVGEVRPGLDALDVLTACFPAGTLSGAPKPRAMELIEELEPTRRGLYGGAIGYVDFHGDLDTAIAIRTALVRDGIAYVQAGAGIVADSDPAAEDAECARKGGGRAPRGRRCRDAADRGPGASTEPGRHDAPASARRELGAVIVDLPRRRDRGAARRQRRRGAGSRLVAGEAVPVDPGRAPRPRGRAAAAALGLLGLAAAAALVATRGVVRQGVGCSSCSSPGRGGRRRDPGRRPLRRPGRSTSSPGASADTVTTTGWPWLAVAGGVLARRWPARVTAAARRPWRADVAAVRRARRPRGRALARPSTARRDRTRTRRGAPSTGARTRRESALTATRRGRARSIFGRGLP